MDDGDEAEKIRDEDEDWSQRNKSRTRQAEGGAATIVAKTTTKTSYPTTAQSYYAAQRVGVFSPAIEGEPASYSDPIGAKFLIGNIGSAIPPPGAYVLCTFIDNRWIFRYDG